MKRSPLLLICIATLACLSSAARAASTAPGITNLIPSSGPAGTKVTIFGANLGATIAVKLGSLSTIFTVTSASSIKFTVPAGAVSAKVAVITASGAALSADEFTVTTGEVVAPTIASFSPTAGQAGSIFSITGTGFVAVTGVRLNGLAANFKVLSATQIDATVPPNSTTGFVAVTNTAGSASSTTKFTVTHPPVISTFAPISGPVGTEVTINGTRFTGASLVRFNNKSTTAITVVSDTQIKAKVPAGTVSGPIAVSSPAGTSFETGKFQVLAPPNISTFSPASGAVGASVTINGSGFTGLRELKFFDNRQPAIVSVTDTRILVTVPAGAATGPLFVRTALGSMTTKGSFFVLTAAAARSGVVLSKALASAAQQTITLTFSANLDASAAEVGHYEVDVAGRGGVIESVAYNAATGMVILGLAEDTLHEGDAVTVVWRDLRDVAGGTVSGETLISGR